MSVTIKKTPVFSRAGVIRKIPEKSLAKVKGDVYKSLSSAVFPSFSLKGGELH
jgi:hypothetical protein